jgi:hypothetical protein
MKVISNLKKKSTLVILTKILNAYHVHILFQVLHFVCVLERGGCDRVSIHITMYPKLASN